MIGGRSFSGDVLIIIIEFFLDKKARCTQNMAQIKLSADFILKYLKALT